MKTHRIGIIMNGVTGRMGTNQHLIRSIKAIIEQGGVKLSDAEVIMPDPILVGRSEEKLKALAARTGVVARLDRTSTPRWPIPANQIYFDATLTGQRPHRRPQGHRREESTSTARSRPPRTSAEALALAKEVTAAGLKNGVVQDKLWLPGLLKLQATSSTPASSAKSSPCAASSATGCSPASSRQLQRPSWNYRKEDDGGIIVDMLCHWQYVIENLFGDIKCLTCLGATHIPHALGRGRQALRLHRRRLRLRHLRAGERRHLPLQLLVGRPRRPRRSPHAAGRRHARLRRRRPARLQGAVARRHAALRLESRHRQPDQLPGRLDARARPGPLRQRLQDPVGALPQARRHRLALPAGSLLEGAKGVQLAELGLKSWAERRWVDVPALGHERSPRWNARE